jgi:hypothetical protein
MLFISLALLYFAPAPAMAGDDINTRGIPDQACYTFEEIPRYEGAPRRQWLYCIERRKTWYGTMCAKMDFPDAYDNYCLSIGLKGKEMYPTSLPGSELRQIFGDELFAGRLGKGERVPGQVSLMDGLSELSYQDTQTDLPPEELRPRTPVDMAREVSAGQASADLLPVPRSRRPEIEAKAKPKAKAIEGLPVDEAGLPVPYGEKKDWLFGIPDKVMPLIKAFLLKETGQPGVNNLLALTRKANLPACNQYLKSAEKIFDKIGVPKIAVLAMIEESECKTMRVSSEGAVGLCQIMPATAKELGLTTYALDWRGRPNPLDDRTKPWKCIPAMAQYMKTTIDRMNTLHCKGSIVMKAIMMYNGGMAGLMRRNICPASDETAMAWAGESGNYIRRILAMGYALDAHLTGLEIPSSIPIPQARALANKNKGKPIPRVGEYIPAVIPGGDDPPTPSGARAI